MFNHEKVKQLEAELEICKAANQKLGLLINRFVDVTGMRWHYSISAEHVLSVHVAKLERDNTQRIEREKIEAVVREMYKDLHSKDPVGGGNDESNAV